MSAELKPCPFCGSSNIHKSGNYHERDDFYHSIDCLNCGTSTINNCYEEYSVNDWNNGRIYLEGNNIKIKSCPFCGHEITYKNIFFGGNRAVYFLYCPECHAQIGDHWKGDYGSPEEVVKEWNTRVISDNEKFLRKILQEMCEIRNDKISSMKQDNSPALMLALMRENGIYRTAQKFLQESTNIELQPKIDNWLLYEDKVTNTWQCPVCKEVIQLMEGTPQENNYNFCPNCGARLEMEM